MASTQEPEIQFAQRLAGNEKYTRNGAIKKLKKYITARSQRIQGGFTGDELLKLWKGLFYCIWMQDKPLLQEELSNKISDLLHSFQNVDSQFLYFESFLQTVKREWTGIDRLRMDKFFQLVRFVFRQGFEMLKRKKWETSLVGRFLEMLTAQVLKKTGAAPCGLQFHILDIYLTELAAAGSAELSADQSLMFIEPFCKTAAKTKDRILLKAICSSVFRVIIDQAPFAIEDLMREMKGGPEDSDSGQASEEEEEEKEEKVIKSKKSSMKTTGKQMNGTKSNKGGDDDDDELLQLEDDSDSELPDVGDVGPVLQFDYSALANKLFELASRSQTPSFNRAKLYRIVKTLRDLNEGIFPQEEYPEEVSTDEDDDEMFGSRKRMKRARGLGEEEDGPTAKKLKGKKKLTKPGKASKGAAKDDNEPEESTGDANKKRKRKKKKKAGKGTSAVGEESGEVKATVTVSLVEADAEKSLVKDAEAVPEAKAELSPLLDSTEAGDLEKMKTSPSVPEEKVSPVKVTEEVTPMETEVQSQTPQPSEEALESQTSVTVTVEPSQPESRPTEDPQKDQLESLSTKNSEVSEPTVEVSESGAEQTETTSEIDTTTTTPAKKKSKIKSLERKAEEVHQTLEPTPPAEVPENLEVSEAGVAGMEASGKDPVSVSQEPEAAVAAAEPEVKSETDATTTTPAEKKSKRKSLKAEKKAQVVEGEAEVVEGEAQVEAVGGVAEVDLTTTSETDTTTTTPAKKKSKRKSLKVERKAEEVDLTLETIPPAEEPETLEVSEVEADVKVAAAEPEDSPETDAIIATPAAKKSKRKTLKAEKRAEVVEVEAQVELVTDVDLTMMENGVTTPLKKKMTKKGKQEVDLTREEEVVTTVDLTLEATHAEEPANAEVSQGNVDMVEVVGEQAAAAPQGDVIVVEVEPETTPQSDATTTPARKSKRQSLMAKKKAEEVEGEVKVVGGSCEMVVEDATATPLKIKTKKGKQEVDLTREEEAVDLTREEEAVDLTLEATSGLAKKKKSKRKSLKAEKNPEEVEKETTQEEETETLVDLTLETAPVEEPAADACTTTPLKKKRKKIQKAEELTEVAVEDTTQEVDKKELLSKIVTVTPVGKKKLKRKATASQESEVEAGVAVAETPAEESLSESAGPPSSEKKGKKKKRKIPVVFEFEADELLAAEEATVTNGLAKEKTTAKKAKLSSEPSTPLSSKKSQKKVPGSDFITFQSNSPIPTPLFCRAKGGTSTPLSSKKKFHTPKSDLKKVTFGLKNNKTAEFKKNDQSLLVSPDGSSRVPFDPKQKPKCGVLKSPVSVKKTPKAAKALKSPVSVKKTPNAAKALKSPVSVKKNPKAAKPLKSPKRPSAADFF